MWLAKILFPSIACLFILLTGSFTEKKVLNFHVVQLIFFFFLLSVVLLVSCLWTLHVAYVALGLRDFFPYIFFLKFYSFMFYKVITFMPYR